MTKNSISILLIIFILLTTISQAQDSTPKITTTSSSIYSQSPQTSIYPAFVDNMPYESWTQTGKKPFYQLVASGGQNPYNWTLDKGSLPDGILLTKDGKLQGTPIKEGTFIFTVKVIDSQGRTAQKQLDFIAESYRAKWFADARFGVWYPFGPSLEPALSSKEDIITYENRIKNFDADKAVSSVIALGGKILNCSVKGGDGIRMWPSTTPSRYELKTSRNIVQELITACHKRGIKFVGYFAPDHSWNKKVIDTAPDGTLGTLNKGLILELVKMGIDGFWVDMGGTPEIYKYVDPKWFPWDEILPAVRTENPHVIFANNPGWGNGGIALRWPDTDILVYEGLPGTKENALLVAKPVIAKKKMAIEVDNLLDTTWAWIPDRQFRKPKSAEMIIKNIKANWAMGATYMLDIPISPDGQVSNPDYAPVLAKIGQFVKENQNISTAPISSLNSNILYDGPQRIQLSANNNARIFYTTDGSNPTTKSKAYSQPFLIYGKTRIKAISIENGKVISKIFDENYNFRPKLLKLARTEIRLPLKNISGAKEIIDVKNYYRGMKVIIGPDPVIIDQIGRQFVQGNKNIHNIVIKRFVDDYPVFFADLHSDTSKVQSDGFQYLNITNVVLEPGQSYIILSKEDNSDKFVSNRFKTKIETSPAVRIVGDAMLTPSGDRDPIVRDSIGSVLSLKFHLGKNATPKNYALGAFAELLDNDDQYTVTPFMGIYDPENAVDGKIATKAQAGGKYAWTLKLDMGETVEGLKQASVDFAPAAFATDFQLFSSTDNITWKILTHKENNADLQVDLKFSPISARYFKLRALKPDGPGQKGGGMGVSEFKVFR
ncbi:FN3 associated domain-containing protein [Dyadobacter sp. CY356]|uniref:FN3 associated domain-containing protein n=1 Tax=Dyadobacter sp. CY356 TaxID=2906442 RepID=UPI001F2E60FB|nr:FN3 associated domain-containing protein [Dyadobacter sp. CY356]MCF0058314.1 alpha-L-fucosidase [Dyadobacter sp. CY356]